MELIIKKIGSNTIVNRHNNNDCWNVALSFACNLDYEKVRKDFNKYISRNGAMNNYRIKQYALKHGYVVENTHTKTIKTFLDDTKYTNYEYLVGVRGHIVYVRHGIVYDNDLKNLKRIDKVLKRKISKRRKCIYDFEEWKRDRK